MDKALAKFLKDRGFAADDSLSSHIATWKSWYAGKVTGFHDYRVYNGVTQVPRKRSSLQLGKTICEQLANLLFNEKCKITANREATQEFIMSVFDENNMYIKLNESQERKSAFGTVCYIPYFTRDGIRLNYITAENMVPLSWENGVINELCVHSKAQSEGKAYTFVQLFTLDGNKQYVVENILLRVSGGRYETVPLESVPGFENLEPIVLTGSPSRPFVVDRLNVANNIDPDSPMGLAVFANAIDTMRFCDLIYDSYSNEFELGKKRVMVSSEATSIQMASGQVIPTFDSNDIVFYRLPESATPANEKPYIHELTMNLRAAEHETALQQGLNVFSSQCGLGENYFRYNSAGLSTATQVISENNTMFRTLKKHEIILEAVLVDLVRLIIEIGIRYSLAPGLDNEAEITVTFDDSIIEDKNSEAQRRLQEVAAGIYRPELYLAWRYGVTEEEALKMMPDMGRIIE